MYILLLFLIIGLYIYFVNLFIHYFRGEVGGGAW